MFLLASLLVVPWDRQRAYKVLLELVPKLSSRALHRTGIGLPAGFFRATPTRRQPKTSWPRPRSSPRQWARVPRSGAWPISTTRPKRPGDHRPRINGTGPVGGSCSKRAAENWKTRLTTSSNVLAETAHDQGKYPKSQVARRALNSFTPKRSLVRSQYRPPAKTLSNSENTFFELSVTTRDYPQICVAMVPQWGTDRCAFNHCVTPFPTATARRRVPVVLVGPGKWENRGERALATGSSPLRPPESP
jgi:hypothetical protein